MPGDEGAWPPLGPLPDEGLWPDDGDLPGDIGLEGAEGDLPGDFPPEGALGLWPVGPDGALGLEWPELGPLLWPLLDEPPPGPPLLGPDEE